MGLDLARLREVNARRCGRWHPGFGPGAGDWSGADWSNASAGEMGEACNVVKKIRRHETGAGSAENPDHEILLANLTEEIADTVIYLDLLAHYYGIDLTEAIIWKFNLVSRREGFPDRLDLEST